MSRSSRLPAAGVWVQIARRVVVRGPTLLLASAALACGGGSEPSEPAPVATNIQVTPATIALTIGETKQLSAAVLDQRGRPIAGQTVSWSSSDTTRIVVDAAGLARGVRPGTATITAGAGAIQGSAAATVSTPSLRFEDSTSATARLGATGGAITARGSNGVRYTLTVPPNALHDTASITVTPVASLGSVPIFGAVRLRPSGLKFSVPVVVTIELSAAPANPADVVGFHFSDDGQTLTEQPVLVSGRELKFLISHFSGVGGGSLALAPALVPINDVNLQMQTTVYLAFRNGGLTAGIDALRTAYVTVVKPILSSVTSSTDVRDALDMWIAWRAMVEFIGLSGNDLTRVINTLAPELSESRVVAATAIRNVISQMNDSCFADDNYSYAATALLFQREAEINGLDTPANGLDFDTVARNLCVKVRYVAVSLPDTVRPGRAETLRVQVGLTIGSGPTEFTFDIKVATTPIRSTDDVTRTAQADGIGVVTRQITPADTLPMQVRVRSCHLLVVREICADSVITRTPTNTLYFNDFAGTVGSEWSLTTTTTSPSGQRFLGELSNHNVALTLTALPVHTQLVLEFDIYIIASWNGNGELPVAGSPDIIEVSVAGGAILKRTTFSNKPRDNQAFPGDFPGSSVPAGTGALPGVSLGYPPGPDYFGDKAYRIRIVFPHSSGTITLHFNGNHSGQVERWGLDNVRVSLPP